MRKEYIEDLENEIWIHNNGYEISNKGRIITKFGKLSKGGITTFGYVNANVVFDDGFHARNVHRAVAYAFIPNPNNLPEVNHKDGIKTNNCVENLEWCTKKENQEHEAKYLKQRKGEKHWGTILTEEKVIEIHSLCREGKLKYKDIAKIYGIFPQEVSDIAKGILWTHLGLEPLPPLTRGARGRSKPIMWINENKEYTSMSKCSDDLRNTYGIIISDKMIKRICEGELSEQKCQKFKYI